MRLGSSEERLAIGSPLPAIVPGCSEGIRFISTITRGDGRDERSKEEHEIGIGQRAHRCVGLDTSTGEVLWWIGSYGLQGVKLVLIYPFDACSGSFGTVGQQLAEPRGIQLVACNFLLGRWNCVGSTEISSSPHHVSVLVSWRHSQLQLPWFTCHMWVRVPSISDSELGEEHEGSKI